MDLVPALPLAITNTSTSAANLSVANCSSESPLLGAGKLDSVWPSDTRHRQKTAGAAHFADILGQTLAGPLFATWSPTAEIIATNKPSTNQANVAALDPNGRRDGRKRSRR